MMISVDVASIITGSYQGKLDSQKSQSSDQYPQTSFDDFLNNSKSSGKSELQQADKQPSTATSEQSSSAQSVPTKVQSDENKARTEEKKVHSKDDKSDSDDHVTDGEEKESDGDSVSTVNTILGQLNVPKDVLGKNGGRMLKGEENQIGNAKTVLIDQNEGNLKNIAGGDQAAKKIIGLMNSDSVANKVGKDASIQIEGLNLNMSLNEVGTVTANELQGLELQGLELQGQIVAEENTAKGANNSLLGEITNSNQMTAAGVNKENAKTRDKDGKTVSEGANQKASESKISADILDIKQTNIGNADASNDKAKSDVAGRKSDNGKRVQAAQNQNANSTQFTLDNASNKLRTATSDIVNKLATGQVGSEKLDIMGRITDVEVIQSKPVGQIRLLRIKLNPESLGMVEARLRKTNEGLHIELHAERQETARLLAADHHMLGKALEKSGITDDGRLTIMVVDRSTQSVQQGQSSNSGQGASQENNGQSFNGQRQSSGQHGQGGQHEASQTFTEFPFTGTPLRDDKVWEENTYRNPDHLVV